MAIEYHYCTFETFKKIIENQTLRLSDIRKSNDEYEMKLFYKQYEGMGASIDEYMNGEKQFDMFIEKKNETSKIWNGIENVIRILPEITECFAICFSSGEDRLSQWERYADKGRGLAIGFERNGLAELAQNINNIIKEKTNETHFVKIVSKKVQYKKIEKSYYQSDAFELVYKNIKNHKYIEKSAFTKHIGFREENEFRIALLFSKGNEEFLNNKKFEEDFLKGKSLDISNSPRYIDIKFSKKIVKKIYLGPAFSEKEQDYIEKLLREKKYNCDVINSDIPYVPKYSRNKPLRITRYLKVKLSSSNNK